MTFQSRAKVEHGQCTLDALSSQLPSDVTVLSSNQYNVTIARTTYSHTPKRTKLSGCCLESR